MRLLKPIVGSAIATILLAVTAGGAVAQEGTEVTEADESPPADCTTTATVPPVEVCVADEPLPPPLPVADYWVEFVDHKQASHGRIRGAVQDVTRSRSKDVRWHRNLVGVLKDELTWLSNHEPLACYGDEYEQWRGAVKDLHTIHKEAVPLVRANKSAAVKRTDKQRRAAMKRLGKALSSVADCGPSAAEVTDDTTARSPLIGSWRSARTFVAAGGFVTTHRATVKLTRDGRFLLRVKRDDACRQAGLGLRPLTVEGTGEYVVEGSHRFQWGSGKVYCYPKGGGRKLLTSGLSNEWRYDDDNDVLVTVDACWWRTKGGSPKDCTAFWRGTPAPAPAEEAEAPADEAASPAEEATASPGMDGG